MPIADTRRFGALSYDETSVLTFPCGLPGFDRATRFAPVEQPQWSPIIFLQSLEDPDLCFLAAPVSAIDAEYHVDIAPEDRARLGLDPASQPLCLALLCAAENGQLTANLLAPVVINLTTRVAIQAVRTDARYSHQHPVAAEAACS